MREILLYKFILTLTFDVSNNNGFIFSGIIGRSWALLFASAGYEVKMYDNLQVVAEAIDDILVQMKRMSDAGVLRGQLSVTEQHQLISPAENLSDCISESVYVQVNHNIYMYTLCLLC